MPQYPNNGAGVTNKQLLEYLELPADTLTNLATAQGTDYQAKSNEFLDALFNKVLYQTVTSMEFTNPFKRYDGFPIQYGDTIENIFVELPKGYKFDKDASDPFTKCNPDVKTLYSSINYEMQYCTTIQDSLLRRACLSEYGMMNLIDTIIGALSKAMNIDEYKATIAMLNNANLYARGFQNLEYAQGATDKDKAELITKTIVNTVSSFKLPMTANNKLGVEQNSSAGDLFLVIKYGLLNSINLDYLTGVYNLSKVDLLKNIVEVDGFQVTKDVNGTPTMVGDDIDFIILDTKGFDMHTALQDGGLIYNPKGKYTNHFYNLWKIMSFKYFYNARAFKLTQKA